MEGERIELRGEGMQCFVVSLVCLDPATATCDLRLADCLGEASRGEVEAEYVGKEYPQGRNKARLKHVHSF